MGALCVRHRSRVSHVQSDEHAIRWEQTGVAARRANIIEAIKGQFSPDFVPFHHLGLSFEVRISENLVLFPLKIPKKSLLKIGLQVLSGGVGSEQRGGTLDLVVDAA